VIPLSLIIGSCLLIGFMKEPSGEILEQLGLDIIKGAFSVGDVELKEVVESLASGPRFSKQESILLYLLLKNGRPMYGLDFVKQSEGAVPKSSIYVTLRRMVEKGILVITGVTPSKPREQGPDRVMYGFGEGYDKIFYIWCRLAEVMGRS